MRNNLPKRILVADDHLYSLEGLKLALTNLPNLIICGEAKDGVELVEKCTELLPDVVITDLKMPRLTGMEAVSILQNVHPEIKVLAWTQYMDADLFRQTMKAGAKGFLYKSAKETEIEDAIDTVLRGNIYYCEYTNELITQMVVQGVLDHTPKPLPVGFFAANEREVLCLICQEYTTSEIARKLSLSPNTVNKYRANLKFKIGTDRFAGLVTFAVDYGILKPEDIPSKNISPGSKR